MNFRPTLAFKVSLLLVLNLLLLAGLGAGWFLVRNHADWNAFIAGPPGDRGQIIADQLAVELSTTGAAERDGLLSRYAAEYQADILWIRNDGLMLAGSSRPLPPAVVRRLKDSPTEDHGPDPFQTRGPGGPERGRFLVWSEPGNYWLGVRLRLPLNGDSPDVPPRTTLLFRFGSVWPLVMLLGLQWWAGVAAFGIGCSILFWLPFVRRVSRRVHRLTETTAQIAEGRFQARAGFGGGDELGRLGVAVDSMAARLESLVEGQKRFLGDAAHEIGSPLARMQVAIEILDDRILDAHKPLVADVREEIQQMTALVNELLEFTRSGLQSRKAELASIALAPLVAKVIAREGGDRVRIFMKIPDGLLVRADEALLSRAVANLLRNAIRYSDETGSIHLIAQAEGGMVGLSITDEGPGVPPAALARLGEPFYRPEAARTREGGGVGLGLAIVRSAVSACGGQVHFANRQPRGFQAELRLSRV